MSQPEQTYSRLGGVFHVVHERGGSKLADFYAPNGVTSEGLVAMWNVATGSPIKGSPAQWYLGVLQKLTVNPALQWAVSWATIQSGAGRWSPVSTQLGWGGLLDPITFDAPINGTTLASVVMQTITSSTAGSPPFIEGLFITNAPNTSVSSAVLWCTAPVTLTSLSSGDVLTISYTLTTSIGTEGL